MDYHDKIKDIEAQLAKARYNKATEKWFGLMKVRLSQLREKIEKKAAKSKKQEGFFVKKSGDATVVLVGFPSVGKSTLLNAITGAKSKTGSYAFTTLDVVPGTLSYNGAKIQILDVPGIIGGAAFGKGRGKEVLAMARSADMILFVVEVMHPDHYPVLEREVYNVNIRVNKKKPDVKIIKKAKDGLSIASTVKLTKVSIDTLKEILRGYKIMNADVVIRDDITIDDFIDVLEGNRSYVPGMVAVTKVDLVDKSVAREIGDMLDGVIVSAETGEGVEELKEHLFESLNFARIFLKEVNKKPDLDVPMVLKKPVTLRKVCERIHRDFVKKFRYAKVWGKGAKFPGQQFQKLDKVLEDGDIVEVHVS
ncbi:GTP-binding protein [Candidatus Woesearchaeota archaeon]|nr:GTP-binding protein [Candidatus Woesearchaeota archaeon]